MKGWAPPTILNAYQAERQPLTEQASRGALCQSGRAELVRQGGTGRMVALQGRDCTSVPLADVAGRDALTGNHLWAEKYDRVLEDIFEVQEELTRSIVMAMRLGPGAASTAWGVVAFSLRYRPAVYTLNTAL